METLFRISLIANRPTNTGIMSKPLVRLLTLNVNLANPSIGSTPTQEINSPILAAIRPLKIFFALRITMIDSPNMASANFSAAPNFSAARAS